MITHRDLTDAAQNREVLAVASRLLDDPAVDVVAEAATVFGDPATVRSSSPVFLEALRAAVARRTLDGVAAPTHVTVVWAMYGETGRMATRGEHPHGEDFVRVKVAQLRWLFDGTDHTWSVIACDDGCPDEPSSAERMEQIIAAEGWTGRGPGGVRVVRLADAIGNGAASTPAVAALGSTADSRKGGSILHAMHEAVADGAPDPAGRRHIVCYTDADLSADLAQVGSLVGPVVDGATVAAGQRYGVPGSVLVKAGGATTEPESTGSKPDRLIVLFRHWVRATLIPSLAHVLDTQAGFKAIAVEALDDLLAVTTSVDESFDVELLIHAAARGGPGAIAVVPIVFTEDFAATNFPSVEPGQRHLDMVVQIADIYDRFVAATDPAGPEGERLIAAVRGATLPAYVDLIGWMGDTEDTTGASPDTPFDTRWPVGEVVRRLA